MIYTPSDLTELRCLLEEDFGKTSDVVIDFDVTVLMRIKMILANSPIRGDELRQLFDNFLCRFFSGHQLKTIKILLYETSLEDVPLHVNDNMTKTFLKWRLIICK